MKALIRDGRGGVVNASGLPVGDSKTSSWGTSKQ